MIRLKEIAAELGVSVSMVSRVLTDKDRVDPEKRKLIKEALERYNYVPNEMARGLRGISSRSIGIIVPTLSSNYYTGIITAAQELAQENGYTVVTCCSSHSPERERDAVDLLKSKQIDKIMCASTMADADIYYRKSFPKGTVVFFDHDSAPGDGIGYIFFDASGDAAKLAEYVYALGHRRFLILNHTSNQKRSGGFIKALQGHGIKVPKALILEDLFCPKLGYEACRKLFDGFSENDRPTAILTTNDFLAYSAIRAARDIGMSIPDDISVACFDACDGTGILLPELTCIMQFTEKIGTLAVRMLMDGKCEHIALDTDFITGTSCKAPVQ